MYNNVFSCFFFFLASISQKLAVSLIVGYFKTLFILPSGCFFAALLGHIDK